MGIDQRCADRGAGDEAEIAGSFGGETGSERGGDIDDVVADAGKAFIGELRKSDPTEIVRVPAPFMGEIGPFAGDRAGRAVARAGGPPAQIVGKIEELSGSGEDGGPVLLQPEK